MCNKGAFPPILRLHTGLRQLKDKIQEISILGLSFCCRSQIIDFPVVQQNVWANEGVAGFRGGW